MLNTKQQEAVNFKNGQMLVVSCPGSGKTTVIVARVHQLIESKQYSDHNIYQRGC